MRAAAIAARMALLALALSAFVGCAASPRARAPLPPSERLGPRCSAGTERLLSTVAERLSVELVVTPSGIPALAALEREMRRVAAVYSRLGARVRVVTAASGEPLPPITRGLEPLELALDDGRRAWVFAGAELGLGRGQKVVAAFDPGHPEAIAYELGLRVRELLLAERRHVIDVAVLTGKHELGLHEPLLVPPGSGQPSPVSIMESAFDHYQLPRFRLSQLRRSSVKALIVTQPGSTYSAAELAELDRFVLGGGRTLVFVLSATRLEHAGRSPPPLALSTSLGDLERLLYGYGIGVRRDLVLDTRAAFELDVHVHDQMGRVSHPALLQIEVGGPLAAFGSLELTLPFASSVTIARERQPADVELSVLARASASAASVEASTGAPGEPRPNANVGLVALAEGRLKSAFGSARAKAASRVLVLGSAFAFSNPFVFSSTAGGVSPELGRAFALAYGRAQLTSSLVALKNLLDWMTLDPDLAACARESRPV